MNRFILPILACACAADPSQSADEAYYELADDSEIDATWESTEDGCPDSWVLTYSLRGVIDITDTPLDMGNASAEIGGLEADELVLRMADDGGAPAEGQVFLTHFNLLHDFSVSVNMLGDFTIDSDFTASSSDECGIASGELLETGLVWDECATGPGHGSPGWTPDEGAYGSGCIAGYHVEGEVVCVDDSWVVSCSDGWLEEGSNPQDYTYNQPLLELEFGSADLGSFIMTGRERGAEVPTYSNNRTWLALEGSLKSMKLEETPDCMCSW